MSLLTGLGKLENVGGFIAFYGLTDWWLAEFTEHERNYMIDHYRPIKFLSNTLTHGKRNTNQPVTGFLNTLASWFRYKPDSHIARRIYDKMEELGRQQPMLGPGYFKGRHFTTYVEEVENLKINDKVDDAESLLIELVKATEAESKAEGNSGVAPFYYEELAKIYKGRNDNAKEVLILERYAKQKHNPGVSSPKLLKRLESTRAIAKKADI